MTLQKKETSDKSVREKSANLFRKERSAIQSRPTSTPLSNLSASLLRWQEDITFKLPSKIRRYPNRDYMKDWLEARRQRFGEAVDFPHDVKHAFQDNAKRVFTENVSAKLLNSGGKTK